MVLLAPETKLPMASSPLNLQSAGVSAEKGEICLYTWMISLCKGLGRWNSPCSSGMRDDRNVLQEFHLKTKVLAAVGFLSAAEGKWDKTNKWKLFPSLVFLPNYSRKRQNKQERWYSCSWQCLCGVLAIASCVIFPFPQSCQTGNAG